MPELGGTRDQRRTVVQIVDSPLVVPSLDVPVPLMVEQLVDVLQFFDALSPDAEQVIEVPKILLEDVSLQTAVRERQLVEQLVEVPTILYFLKQKVASPAPGGGRRLAGLQGFHPAALLEQIVDIPSPGGGLQGFRPGQGSSASSSSSHSPAGVHEDAEDLCEGVFRTFHRPKKSAKVTRHWSARVPRHVSSSTLSAHQMAPGSAWEPG